jgi:integrase
MLSTLKVKNVKKRGRYCDGAGLWLQVGPTGTKAWLFRYMINGRARQMGLGPFPTFSLKEARERARKAKQLVSDGIDPIDAKHGAIAEAKIEAAKRVTFKQCAEEFLSLSPVAQKWTNDVHRQQWKQTLEQYAYSMLGSIPVSDIDVALIKKTLSPVWDRTPVTASRLRGRIELVLAYATASGLRTGDNTAAWRGNLKAIFGKMSKQDHHAALTYAELPAFMERLRAVEGITARSAEFMILTAARTSETINATWDEIDLDAKMWVVPAERMKARREHRVPLSPAVCDLLSSLPRINAFVFPGMKGPISRSAFFATVKSVDPEVTAHGFRSTFRVWCAERTSYPEAVAEQALAHEIGSAVSKSYKRTDLFDKRRRLMTEWARFCYSPVVSSEVVALHG